MDKPFKKKIILLILLILFLGFSGILQDTKVQAAAYSNVSNFKLSLPVNLIFTLTFFFLS